MYLSLTILPRAFQFLRLVTSCGGDVSCIWRASNCFRIKHLDSQSATSAVRLAMNEVTLFPGYVTRRSSQSVGRDLVSRPYMSSSHIAVEEGIIDNVVGRFIDIRSVAIAVNSRLLILFASFIIEQVQVCCVLQSIVKFWKISIMLLP